MDEAELIEIPLYQMDGKWYDGVDEDIVSSMTRR